MMRFFISLSGGRMLRQRSRKQRRNSGPACIRQARADNRPVLPMEPPDTLRVSARQRVGFVDLDDVADKVSVHCPGLTTPLVSVQDANIYHVITTT